MLFRSSRASNFVLQGCSASRECTEDENLRKVPKKRSKYVGYTVHSEAKTYVEKIKKNSVCTDRYERLT